MDVRQKRNKVLGERVVKALESRNMDAYYAETKEEAVQKALEWIPEGSTINMGGASSVHECGLIDAITIISVTEIKQLHRKRSRKSREQHFPVTGFLEV